MWWLLKRIWSVLPEKTVGELLRKILRESVRCSERWETSADTRHKYELSPLSKQSMYTDSALSRVFPKFGFTFRPLSYLHVRIFEGSDHECIYVVTLSRGSIDYIGFHQNCALKGVRSRICRKKIPEKKSITPYKVSWYYIRDQHFNHPVSKFSGKLVFFLSSLSVVGPMKYVNTIIQILPVNMKGIPKTFSNQP